MVSELGRSDEVDGQENLNTHTSTPGLELLAIGLDTLVLLVSIEAGVLKGDDSSLSRVGASSLGRRSNGVLQESHRFVGQTLKGLGKRGQRELLRHLVAVRAIQMGSRHDTLDIIVQAVLNAGQGTLALGLVHLASSGGITTDVTTVVAILFPIIILVPKPRSSSSQEKKRKKKPMHPFQLIVLLAAIGTAFAEGIDLLCGGPELVAIGLDTLVLLVSIEAGVLEGDDSSLSRVGAAASVAGPTVSFKKVTGLLVKPSRALAKGARESFSGILSPLGLPKWEAGTTPWTSLSKQYWMPGRAPLPSVLYTLQAVALSPPT